MDIVLLQLSCYPLTPDSYFHRQQRLWRQKSQVMVDIQSPRNINPSAKKCQCLLSKCSPMTIPQSCVNAIPDSRQLSGSIRRPFHHHHHPILPKTPVHAMPCTMYRSIHAHTSFLSSYEQFEKRQAINHHSSGDGKAILFRTLDGKYLRLHLS